MDEIYLCPVCGGHGLKPYAPHAKALNKQAGANIYSSTIYDVKAGEYKNSDICLVCKGSGYDPIQHPDRIKAK